MQAAGIGVDKWAGSRPLAQLRCLENEEAKVLLTVRTGRKKKKHSWELSERRRAQTMTECAKVRQATVFLVALCPTEAE